MTLRELVQRFIPEHVPITAGERWLAALAALSAILVTGSLSHWLLAPSPVPWLAASMGASAVLLFAVPGTPLAQPWPLIGGHLVSAGVGVGLVALVPDLIWREALAVGVAILAMHFLRCLHPPGAATALLTTAGTPAVQAAGFHYLFAPLALNLLLMLTLALLLNNALPGRRYPAARPAKNPHLSLDVAPTGRLGYQREDLQAALRDMNAVIDVTQADLERIYQRAEMHAYRRGFGELTCGDIMSRDIVSVDYGTHLEEAWALLRKHKIKALPVLDRARRVIGIITLVDFLKRANLKTYEGFEDKLVKFIRKTTRMHTDKPEVVGQIMASPVYSVAADMHIVELVPLLSDRGLHHIPIVDAERRLVGIVTQSDLIAALYHGRLDSDTVTAA